MNRPSDRTIVGTGAASGIGRAFEVDVTDTVRCEETADSTHTPADSASTRRSGDHRRLRCVAVVVGPKFYPGGLISGRGEQ